MANKRTYASFDALAANPPASGYAQIDFRNGHPVLDFDDTTAEHVHFFATLPHGYAGSDFAIELAWTSTAATSGDVRWQATIERLAVGSDLDSDGFGTAAASVTAAPSGAGVLTSASVAIAAASAGSPQSGDSLRLRLERTATDAADTMSGDAELLAVILKEA